MCREKLAGRRTRWNSVALRIKPALANPSSVCPELKDTHGRECVSAKHLEEQKGTSHCFIYLIFHPKIFEQGKVCRNELPSTVRGLFAKPCYLYMLSSSHVSALCYRHVLRAEPRGGSMRLTAGSLPTNVLKFLLCPCW